VILNIIKLLRKNEANYMPEATKKQNHFKTNR